MLFIQLLPNSDTSSTSRTASGVWSSPDWPRLINNFELLQEDVHVRLYKATYLGNYGSVLVKMTNKG